MVKQLYTIRHQTVWTGVRHLPTIEYDREPKLTDDTRFEGTCLYKSRILLGHPSSLHNRREMSSPLTPTTSGPPNEFRRIITPSRSVGHEPRDLGCLRRQTLGITRKGTAKILCSGKRTGPRSRGDKRLHPLLDHCTPVVRSGRNKITSSQWST